MRQSSSRFLSAGIVVCVLAIVLMALYFSGCTLLDDRASLPTSAPQSGQGLAKLTADDPAVQQAVNVQNRHTPDWMVDHNVVGTAVTEDDAGNIAIVLYLAQNVKSYGSITNSLAPTTIDGVPVLKEVTGPFRAMAASSHQVKQVPPVQLGTSGGWRYDLANGYCCSGTLGSLIKKGSTQYVLSNYHVFWGDIVSGGNKRVATAGDPVIQPGLVDANCNANKTQNVATLTGTGSLPGANVDAGYAQVISGMVSSTGAILEVGTISATTRTAALNLAVKKSGRTTGLTRSSISGLNATISVQYETECGGSVAFTKTFTGQIIVKNSGSKFLNSGDSGSLMVEDLATNPKPIGLLFAGSNTLAVANPIGDVLKWAGATMVGN